MDDVLTEVPFLDLSRRTAALRPLARAALDSVLDGGRVILGPAVMEFEEAFASYCGADHGVGVASGTDAIALALEAHGIGAGDEVLTVANTCVPTVSAILSAHATPVLVDAHPQDWTLDPERIEEAIGPSTRAIVPVHLYGRTADMTAIRALADAHNLVVVEDAAQAHGAAWDGVRAGGLGHAAAFSFYPTKNLGGLGDGGMVVTDDAAVAAAVRRRRQYGLDGDVATDGGRNSRLDELQAAVLLAALGRLEQDNLRRAEIARRYDEAFSVLDLDRPATPDGCRPVHHLYVIAAADRDSLARTLAESGVETKIHYPRAIHQHPALAGAVRVGGSLATSERLARQVLSVPLYPELRDDEVEHVIAAVSAACSVR